MSDFSSYREEATLEDIRAGGLSVSLHTADEGNDPDGTNEVTGDGYARVDTTEADWSISGESPTVIENNVTLDFGTAGSDWGNVTHFALLSGTDFETSTVELDNAPHEVTEGEDVSVPAGELSLELD